MLAVIGFVLLGLPSAAAELAGADQLVGLVGPVDDQHPGLRIATSTGVKASIRRPVTLMMTMRRPRHPLMVRQVAVDVFRAHYGSRIRKHRVCRLDRPDL